MNTETIKKILVSICLGAFLSVIVFDICTAYKENSITFTFGAIAMFFVMAICVFGKIKWREFALSFGATLIIYCFNWVAEKGFIGDSFVFLKNPLVIICLSIALAFPLARLFKANKIAVLLGGRHGFYIALSISILLSLFYGILSLLRHFGFESHAYDFGIFDQAIFMLSKFQLPASTVRQFGNLFFDHQHFAIAILAPLYFLGDGFRGVALSLFTPFLLITFPSLILYRTILGVAKIFKINFVCKPYWLIILSSFFLAIHPFTQSAIAFFFHEKYLMPVFFSLALMFFVLYLEKRKVRYWFLGMISLALWLMIKEDQWIFILAFAMTILFWLLFLIKKKVIVLNKLAIAFCLVAVVISSFYGLFFLPRFQSLGANNQYNREFEESSLAFFTFIKNGNASEFFEKIHWNEDVKKYMYQNFLVFDLGGVAVFPLNTLGNYAERIFAKTHSYRNPIFHHGVDVPIYTISGALLIYIWLLKTKNSKALVFVAFFAMSSFLGFESILGWNNVYYFALESKSVVSNYKNTKTERLEFYSISEKIPKDASVVTSEYYLPHLSAREDIASWPDLANLDEGARGKIDFTSFEYWLLPKRRLRGAENINFGEKIMKLKNSDYGVVAENDFQILLRKK